MDEALRLAGEDKELRRRIEIAKLPHLFVTLQAKRQSDATPYRAMTAEFKRIARAANAVFIRMPSRRRTWMPNPPTDARKRGLIRTKSPSTRLHMRVSRQGRGVSTKVLRYSSKRELSA